MHRVGKKTENNEIGLWIWNQENAGGQKYWEGYVRNPSAKIGQEMAGTLRKVENPKVRLMQKLDE